MLRIGTAIVVVVLAVGLVVPDVSAQVRVFHSPANDGVDPGGTQAIEPGDPVTLHLYIENDGIPTATGTVCEDGDGNELCGYDLTIEGFGGIQFDAFSEMADTRQSLTTTRLRLNAVEAVNGVSGAIYIGDLTIDATSGTTVDLVSGQVLDASLNLAPVAPRSLVSVPEPGVLAGLACGSLLLSLLKRWAAA